MAMVLAGCAIHPLPGDVTRDTTYQIVKKIQCEAREALDVLAVSVLRESHRPELQDLADKIEKQTFFVRQFLDPEYRGVLTLDRSVGTVFLVFTLSAIVLDFDFSITETNDNTIDTNFRLPITGGLFTLGLKGGKKLVRKNQRTFQSGVTFYSLHQEAYDPVNCSIAATHGNIVYPITGKIGLEEVFDTFLKLSRDEISAEAQQLTSKKFNDKLTFTTTLSATATPKVALDAEPARVFRLLNATGTFGETRADVHQVSINLAKGDIFKLPPLVAKNWNKKVNPVRVKALEKAYRDTDEARVDSFVRQQRENTRRLDGLE